eukprot:TRINITY_DN40232_c0_g1_i1.p1 TRINITY_DN40232_c0_g1~~TRINITY_DN40232_c0_g1_i1.p1  ORF type:complete len:414 (+),score=76.90 TRINITY_DN40232_c0_g1_i1:80-1243(+)
MADVVKTLEAQRKAHPELAEIIDKLEKYSNAKLYHQLTLTIFEYLASPPFGPSHAGADADLREFFAGFLQGFEPRFDKVRWVQILGIVCKPQTPAVALELIQPYEASVANHRDAKYLWQALKADKQILGGQLDEAKDLLEIVGTEIDAAYEVDAKIQSQYYRTQASLWKELKRPAEFFRNSLLFMAFTPLSAIPLEEQPRLAFEVAVAALIAPDEFEFGELLQKDLLGSLAGTEHAWIRDVLQAFGEGKFEMYDAAFATHRSKIDNVPELKDTETTVLRPKMAVLALMELAFRKPKKQRRLTFEELATHCRVDAKEVEHLVMRAMAANLVKGKVDEVQQIFIISWVKPRILDAVRIDLMRERMDAWACQTGLLLDHLEEMTPELLVS